MKDYIQRDTIKIICKILYTNFTKDQYRIIKIHGGKFQESGLLDLIILIKKIFYNISRAEINTSPDFSRFSNRPEKKLWIEIKRNWKDEPSKLQIYNVNDLRRFGFITGYVVGDEYKINWDDEFTIPFEKIIKD